MEVPKCKSLFKYKSRNSTASSIFSGQKACQPKRHTNRDRFLTMGFRLLVSRHKCRKKPDIFDKHVEMRLLEYIEFLWTEMKT